MKEMKGNRNASWSNIDEKMRLMQEACLHRDRIGLTDALLAIAEELACKEEESKEYFRDGNGAVVTQSLQEADAIADFFDAVYGENVCVTGEWEQIEDERDGIKDIYTGRGYVRRD